MLAAPSLLAQPAEMGVNVLSIPSALSLGEASRALYVREQNLMRTRGLSADREKVIPSHVGPDELWHVAQSKLLEGEALLIYLQQGAQLHGWLIARGRPLITFTHAVSHEEMSAQVDACRRALTAGFNLSARAPVARGAVLRGDRDQARVSAKGVAAQLARTLLPPEVAAWTRTGIRHLTIVPTGDTALLPWPALPLDESGALLIDHLSVSIAPGLGEFIRLNVERAARRGRTEQSYRLAGKAVVVGNPAYPTHLPWQFPPLPGAEREATAVARLMATAALTGGTATKEAVVSLLRQRDLDLIYLVSAPLEF